MKIRASTVKKINNFLKNAQEDIEAPEDIDFTEDEDIPELDEMNELEEDEDGIDEDDVEDIEDKVEDIEETLDTVVDALEDQKEVLEKLIEEDLDGEDFEDEEFEDFVEETKEEEEEDISTTEFGLDDEFAVANKEESMPNLRAERKARMSKVKKVKKAEKDMTLSEEWQEDKSTKNTHKPKAPEVQKGAPAKSEVPDMYKAADLSLEQAEDKNSWNILDKDETLIYVIEQGEIPAEEFATEAFAKKIIKDMQKEGVNKTLAKYNAKTIEKKSDEEVKDTQIQVAPEKDPKEELKEQAKLVANHRRRFSRAMRLAVTAMNKNLVKVLPLKKAMYDVLDELEIPNPKLIVEDVFERGAEEHFETAIGLADKYMDMSDEAFVEFESTVMDSPVADAGSGEEAPRMSARARNLRAQASRNSLPFSSATQDDITDKYSQLEAALPKPKLYNMVKK